MVLPIQEFSNIFHKQNFHNYRYMSGLLAWHGLETHRTFEFLYSAPRIAPNENFVIELSHITNEYGSDFRKVPYYKAKVNELAQLDEVSDSDVRQILDLYNLNPTKEGLRDFWFLFVITHPYESCSLNAATEILVLLSAKHYPNFKWDTRVYALLRRCTYHAAGTGSSAMFDAITDGNLELATALWVDYLPDFLKPMSEDDQRFELIYLNLIFHTLDKYPFDMFKINCDCDYCLDLGKYETALKKCDYYYINQRAE